MAQIHDKCSELVYMGDELIHRERNVLIVRVLYKIPPITISIAFHTKMRIR